MEDGALEYLAASLNLPFPGKQAMKHFLIFMMAVCLVPRMSPSGMSERKSGLGLPSQSTPGDMLKKP